MENKLIDKKLKCCSVMRTMLVKDYLDLVKQAYKDKGGIQGQREPLKQKTAITIRKRMIDDIVAGTVLPPVVIGVIVNEGTYESVILADDVIFAVNQESPESLSIIDGMQRTTALIDAVEKNECVLSNSIRVEFWISCDINSMLYRMLVLNTGQVPWNMRRQVELIFDGVISRIKQQLPQIEIIKISDNQRRGHSGQYNAHDLVEMFMAFGARSWKIDTKERIADEFSRGDFIQSTGDSDVVELFCEILKLMYELDIALDDKVKDDDSDNKFKKGRDLFASQPAKIGYASACGEAILGRPGQSLSIDQINQRKNHVVESLTCAKNKVLSAENPEDYVDFQTLSEVIVARSSKVGDYERDKFYSAFKVLLEMNGEVESFTVCWRA